MLTPRHAVQPSSTGLHQQHGHTRVHGSAMPAVVLLGTATRRRRRRRDPDAQPAVPVSAPLRGVVRRGRGVRRRYGRAARATRRARWQRRCAVTASGTRTHTRSWPHAHARGRQPAGPPQAAHPAAKRSASPRIAHPHVGAACGLSAPPYLLCALSAARHTPRRTWQASMAAPRHSVRVAPATTADHEEA